MGPSHLSNSLIDNSHIFYHNVKRKRYDKWNYDRMRRGYIRLSKAGPSLEDQQEALRSVGVDDFSEFGPVYVDLIARGSRIGDLPERARAIQSLEPGDELVVSNAARLGTTLADVLAVLQEVGRQDAVVLDVETGETIRWHPDAMAVVGFAQRADRYNRQEIAAKMRKERVASGQLGSRPVKEWNMTEKAARLLWADLTKTAAEVAAQVGASVPTLYRRLGDRGAPSRPGRKPKDK